MMVKAIAVKPAKNRTFFITTHNSFIKEKIGFGYIKELLILYMKSYLVPLSIYNILCMYKKYKKIICQNICISFISMYYICIKLHHTYRRHSKTCNAGISRDKTIVNKFMYIPYDYA